MDVFEAKMKMIEEIETTLNKSCVPSSVDKNELLSILLMEFKQDITQSISHFRARIGHLIHSHVNQHPGIYTSGVRIVSDATTTPSKSIVKQSIVKQSIVKQSIVKQSIIKQSKITTNVSPEIPPLDELDFLNFVERKRDPDDDTVSW